MEKIDNKEKIELLEKWKDTLRDDIHVFKDEMNEIVKEKQKREERLSKVIATWNQKIAKKQKLIDKVNKQIAEIDNEITKVKHEDNTQ
jgi:uncharacterized coiled-coil protein SlyX